MLVLAPAVCLQRQAQRPHASLPCSPLSLQGVRRSLPSRFLGPSGCMDGRGARGRAHNVASRALWRDRSRCSRPRTAVTTPPPTKLEPRPSIAPTLYPLPSTTRRRPRGPEARFRSTWRNMTSMPTSKRANTQGVHPHECSLVCLHAISRKAAEEGEQPVAWGHVRHCRAVMLHPPIPRDVGAVHECNGGARAAGRGATNWRIGQGRRNRGARARRRTSATHPSDPHAWSWRGRMTPECVRGEALGLQGGGKEEAQGGGKREASREEGPLSKGRRQGRGLGPLAGLLTTCATAHAHVPTSRPGWCMGDWGKRRCCSSSMPSNPTPPPAEVRRECPPRKLHAGIHILARPPIPHNEVPHETRPSQVGPHPMHAPRPWIIIPACAHMGINCTFSKGCHACVDRWVPHNDVHLPPHTLPKPSHTGLPPPSLRPHPS